MSVGCAIGRNGKVALPLLGELALLWGINHEACADWLGFMLLRNCCMLLSWAVSKRRRRASSGGSATPQSCSSWAPR